MTGPGDEEPDGGLPENLESTIRRWIERSGNALEMRVAREFAGLHPEAGVPYFDQESNKPREADLVVRTFDSRGATAIVYVIECKHSSSPWVLFEEPRPTMRWDRFLPCFWHGGADPQRVIGAVVDRFPTLYPQGGKAAVRIGTATSSANDKNTAWSAALQVLSAARGIAASQPVAGIDLDATVLYVPVLVTSASLTVARLRGDQVALEPVDRFFVTLPAPPDQALRALWVCRETAVTSLREVALGRSETF